MPPVMRRQHGFNRRVMQNPSVLNYVCCYALYDGEAIKIGKSQGHPKGRLAQLQTGSSRELKLLAWTCSVKEREAQRDLRKHHLRGEWYHLASAVLDYLTDWDWLNEEMYQQLRREIRDAKV